MSNDMTGATVELLQTLIRNACVNDGTPESGGETRNAQVLGGYLNGNGVGIEHFESLPGRGSVVARIEGTDPNAPTLCLMGHTDVVPVNANGWSRDPFGGELVDGEVWGRGAIDMLNVTASMAVAFRALASSGWKPKGTLVYSAKAHAALCDDDNKGDLVVTYCTNSTDLAGLVNDHTLYYPRFVRVFLVQPR